MYCNIYLSGFYSLKLSHHYECSDALAKRVDCDRVIHTEPQLNDVIPSQCEKLSQTKAKK
jgi:hypothetical protein